MNLSELFCLIRVWLRALIIEWGWNAQSLQTLSFCWAIAPFLKKLHPKEWKSVLKKYKSITFNQNPFMAHLIIGNLLYHEKRGKRKEAIESLRMLQGPVAGVGDSFFWSSLIPFLCLVSSLFMLYKKLMAPFWIAFLFFVSQLALRMYFLLTGFKKGLPFLSRMLTVIKRLIFPLNILNAFLIGFILLKLAGIKNLLLPAYYFLIKIGVDEAVTSILSLLLGVLQG